MNCRYFERCGAPICPEADNLDLAVWCPGEDICKRNGLDLPWLIAQRKIARKLRACPEPGYFSVVMLSNVGAVKAGLRGVEDCENKAEQAAWLKSRLKEKKCKKCVLKS